MHVRWTAAALALGALLLAGPAVTGAGAEASAGRPTVRALELHGAVDPFIAGYLERGITAANKAGDAAVLLTIDTPGGLESSMRATVKAITGSRVPVICWTGPAGARAASAGTFVMLACPSNAMAHGTNIGAAHPVGVSGAIEQEKVTNDAAAFIRSLAEQTHRNARWAESAVRDSATLSAEQAAAEDPPVADRLADSTAALLKDVDGLQVETAAGTVTLHTADATAQTQDPSLGVALLHGLIDPNLAGRLVGRVAAHVDHVAPQREELAALAKLDGGQAHRARRVAGQQADVGLGEQRPLPVGLVGQPPHPDLAALGRWQVRPDRLGDHRSVRPGQADVEGRPQGRQAPPGAAAHGRSAGGPTSPRPGRPG